MSEAAVDTVLAQARRFTELFVEVYEAEVAENEVGINGEGRVITAEIAGERPVTALLYGRIQSGKTAAMVLTAALALDNAFRIVIVLTADNVELVRQTTNRFRDLEGPRVLSTLKDDESGEWRVSESEAFEEEFFDEVTSDGLIFVCAKNAFHLPQVLTFLQRIDAGSFPCIVFDDEADAATPDHTLQARSSGRANAPPYPSTVHRHIIQNTRPGEEGFSALEQLTHCIYVQVTASPFVLLLQRETSRVHPSLSLLLEPGQGYCGGEHFFEAFDPDADETEAPLPLVLVSDQESQNLVRRQLPVGLAASIEFALISAASLAHSNGHWPAEGYKHLSHTSHLTNQHTLVADHINRHLRTLRREVRNDDATLATRFRAAYNELRRSVSDAPAVEELLPNIRAALNQAQVFRINATTQRAALGPRVNFLIGGNILGRGLTISDLLVTYYLRQAQISQMDTVLQHARMYGYRGSLMSNTRVYLPRQLAATFRELHISEQTLRRVIERQTRGELVPVRLALGTRPTRPGALEGGSLRIYGGGIQQVAPHGFVTDRERIGNICSILDECNVPLTETRVGNRPTLVPLSAFRNLVECIELPADDSGRWSSDDILALINAYEASYNQADGAIVYVRHFVDDPRTGRTRGRLQGQMELPAILSASPNAPALALLYYGLPDAPELWYPTLVLPGDMPAFVFGPE